MNIDVKINNLTSFINSKCDEINKETSKRNRKLQFNHIFYFISKLITNNSSYALVNSELKNDNIVNVSSQAIRKKRNNIDSKYFLSFVNDFNKFIYNDESIVKPKIFAIDGSTISLNKKFKNEGFKLTKNGHYCKGYLSCIYDVHNKIPLGCCIDKSSNERKSFIDNLLKLVPNDATLLFDRGYYSMHLIDCLEKRNIKYVIRMKKDNNYVKALNNIKHDQCINYINGQYLSRVTMYTINEMKYYLCTNIFNMHIDQITKLYHKRWTIEEYYKTLKCLMKLENINCTKFNLLKQELYMHLFITMKGRYLELISMTCNLNKSKLNENKYAINNRNTLNITTNKILPSILFNINKNNVVLYLTTIINEIIINNKIIESHFDRKRIKPVSLWYYTGLSIK
jgi:hypothetical protein